MRRHERRTDLSAPSTPTEPAQVGRVRADFDTFVIASSPRLVSLARLLTGDLGRAEDLVQDAYAKAYLRWGRIRADDPWAYVRRCLVNGYTDWWRRRPWREQTTETLPDRMISADHADRFAERQDLLGALAGLTRRERAVIVLRFYQDLSEVQIADALGISPGTVKSTNARALAKLRTSVHLEGHHSREPRVTSKGKP